MASSLPNHLSSGNAGALNFTITHGNKLGTTNSAAASGLSHQPVLPRSQKQVSDSLRRFPGIGLGPDVRVAHGPGDSAGFGDSFGSAGC
jgi:hypothetical protein